MLELCTDVTDTWWQKDVLCYCFESLWWWEIESENCSFTTLPPAPSRLQLGSRLLTFLRFSSPDALSAALRILWTALYFSTWTVLNMLHILLWDYPQHMTSSTRCHPTGKPSFSVSFPSVVFRHCELQRLHQQSHLRVTDTVCPFLEFTSLSQCSDKTLLIRAEESNGTPGELQLLHWWPSRPAFSDEEKWSWYERDIYI